MGRVIALSRPGAGHPPESLILDPRRACRDVDPEIMFPEPGGATGLAEARAVCRRCPALTKAACLNFAVETDQRFGVFGGLGPAERRKLAQLAAAVVPPAPRTPGESAKPAAPAA